MKVRLCDIAAKTGFSINTVSHALRDLPDISEATKALIRRAAEELDYIPDLQAGSFKSGKRGVISVILPDIVNPHFTLLFHEAETYFQKLGITTFFIWNLFEGSNVRASSQKTKPKPSLENFNCSSPFFLAIFHKPKLLMRLSSSAIRRASGEFSFSQTTAT